MLQRLEELLGEKLTTGPSNELKKLNDEDAERIQRIVLFLANALSARSEVTLFPGSWSKTVPGPSGGGPSVRRR